MKILFQYEEVNKIEIQKCSDKIGVIYRKDFFKKWNGAVIFIKIGLKILSL